MSVTEESVCFYEFIRSRKALFSELKKPIQYLVNNAADLSIYGTD